MPLRGLDETVQIHTRPKPGSGLTELPVLSTDHEGRTTFSARLLSSG